MNFKRTLLSTAILLSVLLSCKETPSFSIEKINTYSDLHNLLKVNSELYSGGEPKTELAFKQLRTLGIKTVISVDGATPKVALAQKYGIRYIHIPIGYDAVPADAQLSLLRAQNEVQKPIYIHCHHGKHRGPAAAAIYFRSNDGSKEQALSILTHAGTSKKYAGLWKDVSEYVKPLSTESLPELVSIAKIGSLATEMAHIDRIYDNLKLLEENGWNVRSDHPDIVPQQTVLIFKERFVELNRNFKHTYGMKFSDQMNQSEKVVTDLEAAVIEGNNKKATDLLSQTKNICNSCHSQFRN